MRRLWFIAVVLLLALSACGDWTTDFSGEGNRFEVVMDISEVGSQSVRGEIVRIYDTNGRADGWFEIGNTHRIHDNCDCHGFWRGRKQYGTVYDYNGEATLLAALTGSECLRIEGRIRSDKDGKTWHDRPVFDSAWVQPCG